MVFPRQHRPFNGTRQVVASCSFHSVHIFFFKKKFNVKFKSGKWVLLGENIAEFPFGKKKQFTFEGNLPVTFFIKPNSFFRNVDVLVVASRATQGGHVGLCPSKSVSCILIP